MKNAQGSLQRRLTSLFVALIFLVLTVTGIIAFVRPFSITIVGLHALTGFLFVVFAVFHIGNNIRPLKRYFSTKSLWITSVITAALTLLFTLQPAPIKAIIGLSANLGPAMDRFELSEDEMIYQYSPDESYKMELRIKTGNDYNHKQPPHIAIWLENQGAYHIKTLRSPEPSDFSHVPYWHFKRQGWEKAKLEAEKKAPDLVSQPTPNGSFDPADYILPSNKSDATPYKLLIEINQPNDPHGEMKDQPSLVYSVVIDNLDPKTYQLLEIVGYPKRDEEEKKETWSLYYPDEELGSVLHLIDSALLTIDRNAKN